MKVTIENVQEREDTPERRMYNLFLNLDVSAALFPPTYQKLYVTAEFTNEEQFIIKKKRNIEWFTLVQGGEDRETHPMIYAFEIVKGKRTLVFRHKDIDWVNYCEDNLRKGLQKFKEALDNEARYFERRPEKKTLEL